MSMKLPMQILTRLIYNERYYMLTSTTHRKLNDRDTEFKNSMLDYYVHKLLYKLYVRKNLNRPKSDILFTNSIGSYEIYVLYSTGKKTELQTVSELIH